MSKRREDYVRHQILVRALHLQHPYPRRPVRNLTVEIRDLDRVAVDQTERAYARARQVRRGRTAQSSDPDDQHLGLLQAQLTMQAQLGEDHLAAVPPVLGSVEREPALSHVHIGRADLVRWEYGRGVSVGHVVFLVERHERLLDPGGRQPAQVRLLHLPCGEGLLLGLCELSP